jgi:hypothetical protein
MGADLEEFLARVPVMGCPEEILTRGANFFEG